MSETASRLVRELKSVPATQWGPLEGGRAEAERLSAQANDIYQRLEQLHADRPAAAADDLDAAAAAVRAGTAAPKTSAVAKIDAEIQKFQRDYDILKVAQKQCADDLLATLLENRATWIDELRDQEDKALASYRETVERLAADRQAVVDARSMRSWLENFETSPRYRPTLGRLEGLRTPAREGTAWPAVVAALRTDLEPQERKPTLHLAEPQGAVA
jgi:hypothetical protein